MVLQNAAMYTRDNALVDSVDDTQSEAVGKIHQVSHQLQRAIDVFSKHAEEVAGPVVASKKLDIITHDEKFRPDVRTTNADALRTCTKHVEVDCRLRRERSLRYLLARLVTTAAVPSLLPFCGNAWVPALLLTQTLLSASVRDCLNPPRELVNDTPPLWWLR